MMQTTPGTITGKGRKRTLTVDGRTVPLSGTVYPFMIWTKDLTVLVQGCKTREKAHEAFKRYVYASGYMIVEVTQ